MMCSVVWVHAHHNLNVRVFTAAVCSAGHESFYDPLPPGSGLYPAKRKEVAKNSSSQLQQKGNSHPVKDKQKQKSLDTAASYFEGSAPM